MVQRSRRLTKLSMSVHRVSVHRAKRQFVVGFLAIVNMYITVNTRALIGNRKAESVEQIDMTTVPK
ncbi:MAG: hypothetical protein NT069_12940 [Planctomycetota bacterium]|nr:hypothetical protein [Planctomycetota bacterium]